MEEARPSGRLPPSQGCTGVGAFCASMNVCERYTCMICLTMYAYIHTYIHIQYIHTSTHAYLHARMHVHWMCYIQCEPIWSRVVSIDIPTRTHRISTHQYFHGAAYTLTHMNMNMYVYYICIYLYMYVYITYLFIYVYFYTYINRYIILMRICV